VLERLSLLKRLFRDLPRQVKLAYCLLFDERVPPLNKLAVGTALAAIVTPFVNVPAWIPVVGEMDVLALTLVTTRLFISSAPRAAVEEQQHLIKERRSRFDQDVARGERLAVGLARAIRHEPHSDHVEFVGTAQSRPSAATQQVSGVVEA
jgi:uncharacterized membrane protein YkvA (DUF1232 family)